jgi:hypothetical protein
VIEQLLYAQYLKDSASAGSLKLASRTQASHPGSQFKEMTEHEQTHMEFLQSAIVAAGSEHIQRIMTCKFSNGFIRIITVVADELSL